MGWSEHGSAFPRISAQVGGCLPFRARVCYNATSTNAVFLGNFCENKSYFGIMDTRSLCPHDNDVHQLRGFSESHVVFSHVWQTGELLHLCEIFVARLIWSESGRKNPAMIYQALSSRSSFC